MKLKEKLAAQHLGSLENEGGLSHREMKIFIAGFEKAREMAVEALNEYSYLAASDQDKVTEGRGIIYKVKQLGEGEVE